MTSFSLPQVGPGLDDATGVLAPWPVSQFPQGYRGLGCATPPTSNRLSGPHPQKEGGEGVARLTPGVATCRLKAALANVKQWRKDGADTPAKKTAPGECRARQPRASSCSQSSPSPSSCQGSRPHLPQRALSRPGHLKPSQKANPSVWFPHTQLTCSLNHQGLRPEIGRVGTAEPPPPLRSSGKGGREQSLCL